MCWQAEGLSRLLSPLDKRVKQFYGGIKSGAYVEADTGKGASALSFTLSSQIVDPIESVHTLLHKVASLMIWCARWLAS
jgi:hypothetical protein